jgi:oxygen-independent coproporphyrinogen-3 oxidase
LLYVGIPFCPSRCKYCSFVSESVEKSRKLIPEYTDLLVRELQLICQARTGSEQRTPAFDAVYIGGGTPTSLPVNRLERLLAHIPESRELAEFTVEAGRPETLTPEVLRAFGKAGATRISINPQSMNDDTLRKIGRGHDSREVCNAYEKARNYELAINMDLIAGLPGEECSDFIESLNKVIELNPDDITVHSLARKRAARSESSEHMNSGGDFTKPAYDILKAAGYYPYYLYRQSNCAGDNIGYTRRKPSLYNICMADESGVVYGAGCGAATRTFSDCGKTQKHYNFKFPYEYISRFAEITDFWRKL